MKRPRPVKRKPVVGKLTAVDLAAIERIVERVLAGRIAGLKATIAGRRGGCG